MSTSTRSRSPSSSSCSARHLGRLRRGPVAPRRENMMHLNEWGLGGRGFGTFVSWFLLGGDLYTAYTFIAVPALVYALGAAGFFALSLHHHGLPDRVRVRPAAVVGRPGARLRDPGRLRPGPLRLARPGARDRGHRDPRHHALHRAAAGRHPGGADRHGRGRHVAQHVRQGPAADHRVHHPGRLHLPVRPARARADRVRQGHADLRDGHRRDLLHPDPAGRLGAHLQRRRRAPEDHQPEDRQAVRLAGHRARRRTGPTPPWRSAPRWRCSCTRTRSPGCSPPSGAT